MWWLGLIGIGNLGSRQGQPEPITPLVYEVVEQTTGETTILDVLFGALSIVGVIGGAGILLGVSLAILLIGRPHRWGKQGPVQEDSTRLKLNV